MFLEHDFYGNFSDSVRSGDTALTNNIIVDELSELVIHDYDKLFDLLGKVGIRVNRNISDEQLVDVLLDQMQVNPKLGKGVAFLIAEKNGLINNKTDEKSGKKYVDYVNRNLTSSFNKILSTDNERIKFKTDLMNSIKSKDSTVAERTRKVNKPNYFWRNTLIVSGVILVSYLVYKNWDKLSGKEKLADGGNISEAVTPTPTGVDVVSAQAPEVSSASVSSNLPPSV